MITTDWKDVIERYEGLEKIQEFVDSERKKAQDIFPPKHQVFRCFDYFDVKDTKVVILGQDPYHTPNVASGLCFGVADNQKTPPSFRNIQAEMVNDIGVDLKSKTLEYWAQQGVLLLNSALTVVQHKPASHMIIWLPFTKYIID